MSNFGLVPIRYTRIPIITSLSGEGGRGGGGGEREEDEEEDETAVKYIEERKANKKRQS